MTTKKHTIKEAAPFAKIVVNVGVGKMRNISQFDDKVLPAIVEELRVITGQQPAVRKARQSISTFKIRQGDVVGLQITLRGKRMMDYFTRLVTIALPRVKDFRGLPLSNVDGHGILNLGVREQTVFPEIIAEKSFYPFGVQTTVVPKKLMDRETAIELYRSLGVPLKATDKE
jgi:large subunit ribosomal protein L5